MSAVPTDRLHGETEDQASDVTGALQRDMGSWRLGPGADSTLPVILNAGAGAGLCADWQACRESL